MPDVLVVDDEATMRFCLERLLRRYGYDVRTAADAEAALAAVTAAPPDAIILDVVLDDVDGCALCRELRAASPDRELKILMVSARSQPDDVEKGLAAGADGYLPKPFAIAALTERLTAFFALGRA